MAFSFYNHTKQKLSLALQVEWVSIGCEAWIDVSRFCAAEKPLPKASRELSSSRGHAPSPLAHNPLTKSFTLLHKKLRRNSPETLD